MNEKLWEFLDKREKELVKHKDNLIGRNETLHAMTMGKLEFIEEVADFLVFEAENNTGS